MVQSPSSAGFVIPPTPTIPPGTPSPVPFREATRERTDLAQTTTVTMTTGQQPVLNPVNGSGYWYRMLMRVVGTTSGNSANVAFQEDAPWNVLKQVENGDPTGNLLSLTGFNLYLKNKADANFANSWLDKSSAVNLGTTGAGSTGGSFNFMVGVPISLNRRTLLAIVGNQDRALTYQLRTDIAPSSDVYSTAPTTLPSVEIDRIYESYSVPPPQGLNGPNETMPSDFGTVQFATSNIDGNVPIGGSSINHYIARLGNTLRYFILVFRSNGLRATAEANAPTKIQLQIGDMTFFNEYWWYRKARMYENYGFDWDNGVIVYDALHDFAPHAGNEQGVDWWNMQQVARANFQITYPSGFGSTNNSLTMITSELALVGQPLVA